MTKLQKILYVEDEIDIQKVAQLALEMVGQLTVKVCSSGEEALSEVIEFNPDLILLDVMMPGMDGPTTLKEIRNLPSLENIPVAFMTAKVQPSEIEHFKSLGALDVIAKPFDPMELANQVQAIWKVHNEKS
ncbi:response regulator [Aliikangiella sp. IMCC44359]|uniref:response regulator n=1 Tax=Aliikangiella sp. IMCC44359 TaxID=3459125 RepID=UPI00403ADE99